MGACTCFVLVLPTKSSFFLRFCNQSSMLLPVVPLNLMDEEKLDAGVVGLLPALTFQSFALLLRVALVLLAFVLFF